MRRSNLIVLAIVVAIFLAFRGWIDRQREQLLDTEIIREGDEHLGRWSGRIVNDFFYLRLKRDGSLSCKHVPAGGTDTIAATGRYEILDGLDNSYFPRIVAVDNNGDTLFNFYLASVTPYGSTDSKADRMVLKPNSLYDTGSYVFFRVDPDDFENAETDFLKDLVPGPDKDVLTAEELVALSSCTSLACVQGFMKNRSNNFLYAVKGEFAARHRSLVYDTAGNGLIMPLSTVYVDVSPQAYWRMAHTLHREDLADQLLREFQQLGFRFMDSGYFRGWRIKRARYLSEEFPGRVLYVARSFSPWNLRGLYRNVSWVCFVFEMYGED